MKSHATGHEEHRQRDAEVLDLERERQSVHARHVHVGHEHIERGATTHECECVLRAKQRDYIKHQLDRLVKERASFVRGEEQKRRAAGSKDGFDAEVMKAVKTQAASRAKVSY